MKIEKLSFDNFKESQLSAVGMQSIKGGLLPGGTPGGTPVEEVEPIDPIDPAIPQNGGPVSTPTISSSHIKDSAEPIIKQQP